MPITMRGVGAALTFENPSQRFAARLSANGVEIHNRDHRWMLSLYAYGYGDSLVPTPLSIPVAAANRVEYRRGVLTEWYVNGPAGLEQGFTVQQPPGKSRGKPLTLALTISGDLRAEPKLDGSGLVLFSGGRQDLRYAGLTATDADGKSLPTILSVRGNDLLLQVSAGNARYPIVIDPFIQQAELSVPKDPGFGGPVAASGNTLVVGGPFAKIGSTPQGAVYVFVEPVGGWTNVTTYTAKLVASDGAASDQLGASVAINGNTVVAGAPNASQNKGAAYVYVKPASGWVNATETAKLTQSECANGTCYLGGSVAISGNTIAAGAPFGNSACIYVEPLGGWVNATETALLTVSNISSGDEFANSIALNGTVLVAGAPNRKQGKSNFQQGEAYVFIKPPGGWKTTSSPSFNLIASDGKAFDFFGAAVATDGRTVVVGAPQLGDPQQGPTAAGKSYVFVKGKNGVNQAILTSSDGQNGDSLGSSVAVNGNSAIAGAYLHPFNSGVFGPGAAYSLPEAEEWMGVDD